MKNLILTVGLLVAGCKAPQALVEAPPPVEERYRPSWTANVALHTASMRKCLEGREAPAFVLMVEPLSTGAEGVTTVDAYGSVENCAYEDGRVLRRQAARESVAVYRGLPLFALGKAQPVVPVGVVVEEVVDGSATLGWLFWPHEETSSAAEPTTFGDERIP